MITLRPALFATAAALGLVACGDERGGASDSEDGPGAPFGVELAMAATPATEDGATDSAAPVAPKLIGLTAEELAAKLKQGNIRLIDVRTDAEVAEGVIPGAEHISLDSFNPAALDLSDGREVVLYCRSGRRSAIAGEKLAAATGKRSQHLAGGILAWEAAEQPVAAPR